MTTILFTAKKLYPSLEK
uniref:Uncharacterized protein n=1 Tax=Anguilla anguilla TaxID=7936 RepID=A0A0E9R3I4_ANGAN